jgi:hypothetical protein
LPSIPNRSKRITLSTHLPIVVQPIVLFLLKTLIYRYLFYNLGGLVLNNPQDLTIDQNDNVYIADYGNSRIIKYSLQTDDVLIIGEGILNQPTGCHVGRDGHFMLLILEIKKDINSYMINNLEHTL